MSIPESIIILDDDLDDHDIIKSICENIGVCAQGFFLKGHSMAETEGKLRLILEYWIESKRPNSV